MGAGRGRYKNATPWVVRMFAAGTAGARGRRVACRPRAVMPVSLTHRDACSPLPAAEVAISALAGTWPLAFSSPSITSPGVRMMP